MKNNYYFPAVLITMAAILSTNVSARAANAATTTMEPAANIAGKAIAKVQQNGDKEIDNRITALNNLVNRVSEMKNVTDAVKNSLTAQTRESIANLTALKSKIDSDTTASSTLADKKTITADYRVYALIIPQGYVISAADRINTIAQTITNLSAKLAAKITEAQTAGKDVAKIQASLTDMNIKINAAKTQAQTAQTAVATLTPDQGDQTKAQANHAALVAARANIKTATQDINAARKDALTIVQALKGFGIKTAASANATTTASTTTAN